MKYWHWLGIAALVFICIKLYENQTLKSVPLIGSYVSAS
jgi:hypothetical protein